MHLYIKTPYGRFADTLEIDSDNLSRFLAKDNSDAKPDSIMVEEYEELIDAYMLLLLLSPQKA